MCYADVTAHADGTFTADCYCGWSSDPAAPFLTEADAERAAALHQNAQDTDPAGTA
jgi:hypothetical protein